MRKTLLSAILLMAVGGMVGCMDVTPCTVDEDCAIDFSWGDRDSEWGDGGGSFMVCNLEVSPLEACEEMMGYMPSFDFLPFGDWMRMPDCTELYGDLPEGTGSCESSMSLPFF